MNRGRKETRTFIRPCNEVGSEMTTSKHFVVQTVNPGLEADHITTTAFSDSPQGTEAASHHINAQHSMQYANVSNGTFVLQPSHYTVRV